MKKGVLAIALMLGLVVGAGSVEAAQGGQVGTPQIENQKGAVTGSMVMAADTHAAAADPAGDKGKHGKPAKKKHGKKAKHKKAAAEGGKVDAVK